MSPRDPRETQRTRAKYNRTARLYNVLEFPMELFWYGRWRKQLFDRVKTDRFLEIGVGTGKNLRFHPADSSVVAADVSEGMLSRAAAVSGGGNLALIQADAQQLPFCDHSFETVVATFVFCSVPDPVLGFQEIRRVLKPTGRLLLLEHVLPQQPVLAWLFNVLDRTVAKLSGVHINRRTADNMRKAGFDVVHQTNLLLSIFQMFEAKPVL